MKQNLFPLGQVIAGFAQLLRAHAEVVSGAYKFGTTERRKEPDGPWVRLTEEELLKHKLQEMKAHTRRIEDAAQCIDCPSDEEPT